MRVYKVTHTSGLDEAAATETFHGPGIVHFGSHAEARRWCNERIREALARWKQYDSVTRLADVQWGEEIEIAAVETVSVTKAVLVRLLNTGAGHVDHTHVIERWTPQDKWQQVPRAGGES